MTVPSLDQLQADAQAISATGSPNVRKFCLDTVAYLRGLAPAPPAQSPYVTERLFGALDNPAFWYNSPQYGAPYFAWIMDGPGGVGALRVTAPACKSPGVLADGTPVSSSSVSGQLVGLESHVSSSQVPFVHCGYASGDPSASAYPGASGKREEVWYRWRQRWPTGYRPTLGTQNSTMEWHFDRVSEKAFGRAVSPLVLVEGVGGTSITVGGVTFDTAPSTVAQVMLQFPGGGTSETGIGVRVPIIMGAAFQLDHWYDFVAHWIFDPDPAIGWCQLWIDGAKVTDLHRSTQYLRPDGTRGYQEDVGVYNYRHWANFASSVDYAQIVWGPTAASVGA